MKQNMKNAIGLSLKRYNETYMKATNDRIDNIVAQSGTDNTEIVDARIDSAGVIHTTLNNRILAETKMNDEQLVTYTSNYISAEDTTQGYLKNIEILGNTIQDEEDLADIRSVGDKVEGQELYKIPVLSCGKNLFNLTNQEVTSDRIKPKFNEITIKQTTLKNLTNKTIIVTIHKEGVYAREHRIASGSSVTINLTNGEKYKQLECLFSEGWSANDIFPTNGITITPGTVATEYEPYVEDKITILSPTPLEKIGDVADRIIEKDGVWGVEKNVKTIYTKEFYSRTFSYENKADTFLWKLTVDTAKTNLVTNFMQSGKLSTESSQTQAMIYDHTSHRELRLAFNKSDFPNFNTESNVKEYLSDVNKYIKIVQSPTFIPLPHDQQVKLRTFANKTNISFLTEIEGTIKAQVPKSLGATVNTHTTQISNLNKELDRVKKLEESTVSTVETESDFTTVEATSNGYFDDVKLEGKTLVNLLPNTVVGEASDYSNLFLLPNTITKSNTYTLIPFNLKHTNNIKLTISSTSSGENTFVSNIAPTNGVFVFKCANQEFNYDREVRIRLYVDNTVDSNTKYVILEGDHTQNPPSGYIEGLKSVGQSATTSEDGADEIVVSSVNGDGNLVEYIELNGVNTVNGKDYTDNKYVRTNYITVEPNQTYYIKPSTNVLYKSCSIYFYDSNKSYLGHKSGLTSEFTTVANTKFIRIDMKKADDTSNTQGDINNCDFVVSKCRISEYIPYQSDKKRLLFYDEETQTWEKPILREWDSIEKHSDGKYYYHQRSWGVVFDGTSGFAGYSERTNTVRVQLGIPLANNGVVNMICDKLQFKNIYILDEKGIYASNKVVYLSIPKSELSSLDVNGVNNWLTSNNVTVVYQLAEEKVYECTNIDLITYANETNYIVESGAIVPRTTLKVHNNISNVVSLLQKKVSLLESNMTKYMITQNRMQLASTYSADSVTFKVDYTLCSEEVEYNEDLYNLILNNILVGKDNYDYDKMFTMVLDYASWNQISWEQFDILVGLMDMQHNPPIEEIPTDDEIVEEIPNEIM